MIKSIGKYFIFLGTLFTNRESFKTYARLFVDESVKVGTDSVILIAIVSILVHLTQNERPLKALNLTVFRASYLGKGGVTSSSLVEGFEF